MVADMVDIFHRCLTRYRRNLLAQRPIRHLYLWIISVSHLSILSVLCLTTHNTTPLAATWIDLPDAEYSSESYVFYCGPTDQAWIYSTAYKMLDPMRPIHDPILSLISPTAQFSNIVPHYVTTRYLQLNCSYH